MPEAPADIASSSAKGIAAHGSSVEPASVLQQPHSAAELSRWLATRATPTEAKRVERFMDLVQQVAGESVAPRLRPRPASTLGIRTGGIKLESSVVATASLPLATAVATAPKALGSRCVSASQTQQADWHYTTTTGATTVHSRDPGGLTPSVPAAQTGPAGTAAAAGSSVWGRGLRPSTTPAGANLRDTSRSLSRTGSNSSSNLGSHADLAALVAPADTTVNSRPQCINITSAQAYHGLRELYPDLWAATTPICRPQPAPNKTYISEWGDSLKQGAAEAWAPYLASSYQVANLQVAKPTDDYAVRADEALISWVAKQKLYSQGLLTPQAAAAVEALLQGRPVAPTAAPAAGAASGADAGESAARSTNAQPAGAADADTGLTLSERKNLVEVLRLVSTVVHPQGAQSEAHTSYKQQYSVEQPETTTLMKQQTRIKTMGVPKAVTVKGFCLSKGARKTAAAATADDAVCLPMEQPSAGPQQHHRHQKEQHPQPASRHTAKAPKASDTVDTLSSKVPIKWAAAAAAGMPTSTYSAAFGGQPNRSTQMMKTVFKDVNVGFGHVDTNINQPGSAIYPVEQLYLQPITIPGQAGQATDQQTTMRASYKPRDPESVARSVAAAQEQLEASRAGRNKSFIPLSKAGIQLGSSKQWVSTQASDFIPRHADLSANRAMASAVSAMFTGPTISYGKIAGMRQDDAAGIQKWKQQQAETAAAKAAAEAALDQRIASAKV